MDDRRPHDVRGDRTGDVAGSVVGQDGGFVPLRSGAGSAELSTLPFLVRMPTAYRVQVAATLYRQKGRSSVTVETVNGSAIVTDLLTWDAWVEFYKTS